MPGEAADYVKWRAAKEGLHVRVAHDLREVEPSFDVIFSLDVVEHLVDMRPVGDAWRAMLKPGGRGEDGESALYLHSVLSLSR